MQLRKLKYIYWKIKLLITDIVKVMRKVEGNMENKENILDSKELKKHAFEVPEGYFETFPSRISERISSQEETKSPSLFRILKPQVALAAIIIVFAVISYTAISFITNNQIQRSTIEEVDVARILEYDSYGYYEDNPYMDILMEEEKPVKEEEDVEDIYMHYLLDENIDYGTLIDELK